MLHTKPRVYIEDITVRTGLIGDTGIVKYIIQPAGLHEHEVPICRVTLTDAEDILAVKEPIYGFSGTLHVPYPNLWWPRGMSSEPGYLYTLKVRIILSFYLFPLYFLRLIPLNRLLTFYILSMPLVCIYSVQKPINMGPLTLKSR